VKKLATVLTLRIIEKIRNAKRLAGFGAVTINFNRCLLSSYLMEFVIFATVR